MNDEARKKKFTNRVTAWRAMKDVFGSWDDVAKHFEVSKPLLIRTMLDDLEQTWGTPLGFEKMLEEDTLPTPGEALEKEYSCPECGGAIGEEVTTDGDKITVCLKCGTEVEV